ncbi:SDR family NAD(P)-dependent oxidoreductase [Acinetobacter pragensis]|uniref:SDR family NAD(P)-dependent oxidoreductase n=1 Tax=Acinetobacter pragensis TaxID=1806892 RepID=UPI00333F1CCA
MKYNFENKVAMITGAGSGIGQAASLLLASYGCNLCLVDLNEENLSQTKARIKQDVEILIKVGDVTDTVFLKQCVDVIDDKFKRLDFAFNNAGMASAALSIADLEIEMWNKQINVNLNSIFYCMHYQIPLMLKTGGGAIVNTSSILGTVAARNRSAYIAAKHGVTGLSKAAALDYADQNIRVNSIHPGYIETPLIAHFDTAEIERKHPMQRLGKASEIAELVSFLLSGDASFVTGANYAIDGGYVTQ